MISGIEFADRDRIIDLFRNGNFLCLIATNVLARGIDIPAVDIVINYDIPQISDSGYMEPDYANYLQRVGRTGRFGSDGIAITLTKDEVETTMMNKIQKHYNNEIKQVSNLEEFFKDYQTMREYLYSEEKLGV